VCLVNLITASSLELLHVLLVVMRSKKDYRHEYFKLSVLGFSDMVMSETKFLTIASAAKTSRRRRLSYDRLMKCDSSPTVLAAPDLGISHMTRAPYFGPMCTRKLYLFFYQKML